MLSAAVAAAWIASPGAAKEPVPSIGQQAPSFRFTTIDGQDFSSDDFHGQVIVVNFWATWCGPCKEELPLLDAFYRIQGVHGMRVVAVTTEDSLPAIKLKKLASAVSFMMARRFRGPYAPLTGVPTNYIIDRAGVLRYAKSGAFTLDSLNALLVPLLLEPAPARPITQISYRKVL